MHVDALPRLVCARVFSPCTGRIYISRHVSKNISNKIVERERGLGVIWGSEWVPCGDNQRESERARSKSKRWRKRNEILQKTTAQISRNKNNNKNCNNTLTNNSPFERTNTHVENSETFAVANAVGHVDDHCCVRRIKQRERKRGN